MTNFATIKCELSSTNPAAELETEVWLGDTKIFDGRIIEPRHIEYRFNDDEDRVHELKFVLKNKNDSHTVLDHAGNIVKDSTIKIENLKFDDIELGHLFYQLANYHHNRNGHGEWANTKFFGEMGCNGTVTFKFTTPVYLWLLENM